MYEKKVLIYNLEIHEYCQEINFLRNILHKYPIQNSCQIIFLN
jgi:hypothetical protein